MKKLFILISLAFLALNVSAQQDPQFSQFWFTRMAINPGYAGANGAYCGTLIYRDQWAGFGGEPKTLLFSLDAPVYILHGGLGLVVSSDQLGFNTNRDFSLSYAYRAQIGNGRLGIGLSAGYYQQSIDGSKFIFNDLGDNSIPTANVSAGTFDLGFGAYYNTDNLYVGISSLHLQEGQISLATINGTTKTKLARHYYLNGGYTFELTPTLDLKPAILVKTDAASTQADINADVVYNKQFWGGLSYRLQDAVVINLGLQITEDLKLGLAYDLTTSAIKTYSSGSYEVAINYCHKFIIVKPKTFHKTVRFL